MVGVASACLVAISLDAIRIVRARVTEERQAKIRAVVQTAHGVIAHYGGLAESGALSHAEAHALAVEAVRALRYHDTGYFWITDLQGGIVMHPIRPEFEVGERSPESGGEKVFLRFASAVRSDPSGEAFVAYRWPKPDGGGPVRKLSFVKLYRPWGWIVGSGTYLDDADAVLIAEARRVLAAAALLALLFGAAGIAVARNVRRIAAVEREREQTESRARRQARALRALSACNEALMRANDETALLESVCRITVEVGGYRLAWVGIAEHDERKTVRVAARAGHDDGYLDRVDVVWSDAERGRGPVGRAVRSGLPVVSRDFASDPDCAPWRAAAMARGFAATIALPLAVEGVTFGALAIHAAERDRFDDDEMRLLVDLANDLAFGFAALRGRAERARMTTQLVQADRLAALGTLAAGVAHEINNPLAYVLGGLSYVTQALDELAPGLPADRVAELRQVLAEMRDGGARIRQAVRDLKSFTRSDEESRWPLDVQDVLETSLHMSANEIRHRARLVKRYDPIPRVIANECRLGQVFLNLLINAAQAIPEGAAERHEIAVVTRTEAGRAVVEICDTGAGIAPEHLGRIFEPFFTTKPVGVGTGLGLPICRNVVTALGGELTVESTPGEGSVFRVVLPAAASEPSAQPPAPEAAPSRGGRILAIDDEPLVGAAVRRALETEHDVVTETDGRAALDRLARGERFDVVICDLMMPDKSGMDLYADLAEVAPALAGRVLFLTGGAFTPKAKAFLEGAHAPYLEKPFDTRQLRTVVRDLLAPRP